eukprot:g18192.t1
MQTLAFSQKVQIPAMFVNSNSAFAWFLWIAGIFIAHFPEEFLQQNQLSSSTSKEMGLMLNFERLEEKFAHGSSLPKEKFQIIWEAFALGDTSFEVQVKLGYLATTMLLSTGLRRIYRFGAAVVA